MECMNFFFDARTNALRMCIIGRKDVHQGRCVIITFKGGKGYEGKAFDSIVTGRLSWGDAGRMRLLSSGSKGRSSAATAATRCGTGTCTGTGTAATAATAPRHPRLRWHPSILISTSTQSGRRSEILKKNADGPSRTRARRSRSRGTATSAGPSSTTWSWARRGLTPQRPT